MSTTNLSGQVAFVTGASQGIGLHLVTALAERGVNVAGMARRPERLRTALDAVSERTGGPTLTLAGDVTDRRDVETAVADVIARFGPIDLLVNCAGLIDAAEVAVWEADVDQWWSVVASHIRGAQLTISAAVPAMVQRGRGRIVNLASSMGTRPEANYSAYSVAKAGQIRLTESLAAALVGTGVYAFNVAPGLVRTKMTASMPKWDEHTAWTPPERVVELVCAVANGDVDSWTGRFLRAGVDLPQTLRPFNPAGSDRQLRLWPYGPADPLA